jgi:hypothetical protein
VQEGTAWDLPPRHVEGTVPLIVNTRCKIKGLTDRTAEIDLFGSIQPTNRVERAAGWKVSVLGGRCMGSCTVDRTTGLPTNSRVERYIDLMLESPDGAQLPQRKEIVTTIQAFLPGQASASSILPISHTETSPPPGTPQPPESSSAARSPRPSSDELRLFR